ncbi:uncharacterized protein EI97DRAFT_442021 [Westerdykella ornata]|uniref:Uncharacterized protein n=1 Tax=Westerdykella ornata TaxID=318751 RepID=A0A6A6JK34_WESOR|nr:uncharacterized protein EI97DRAFT_442021 [Westerdykella ornata]KAF2276624.1 hypothetical protein EI97DRAFT_442021 [Westerdykella ornata]
MIGNERKELELELDVPMSSNENQGTNTGSEVTTLSKRQHLQNIADFVLELHGWLSGGQSGMYMEDDRLDHYEDTLSLLLEFLEEELHGQPNTAYSTPNLVLRILKHTIENLRSYLIQLGIEMELMNSLWLKHPWVVRREEEPHSETMILTAEETAEWVRKVADDMEKRMKEMKERGDWDPELFAQPPKQALPPAAVWE